MKKFLKDGSLYYRQRDIFRPMGLGLMVVGLIWFYFGYSMASYYVPGVMVPAGLVFFIVGGARHVTDNDVNEQITHALESYDTSVTDLPHFDRAVLSQPAPVECRAYSFGAQAAYFKKNKSGTPVSDILTGAHFFFTKDSLLVATRTVCLSTIVEGVGMEHRDFSDAFPLSALSGAALEEHTDTVTLTASKKPLTVKWCELVLTARGEDGTPSEALRIPVPNDMDMATLCEDINRRCGR